MGDMDELPVKKLIIIGQTGMGKSTLMNALRDPAEHDSCVRPRRNAQPSPLGVVAGPGGSSRAATQGAHRARPTPHPAPSHAPRAHSARPARLRRPHAPPAPREPLSAALARSPALAHRCAINSGEGRRRRGAAWRGRRRQAVEHGAGRGPRAPGRLPVALESYSSRGRGRRVAGGGVRM